MSNTVAPYRSPAAGLIPQNMDEALRLAQAMSKMKSLPDWLHDAPDDCLQIVELAMRWGMSPFAVAQCTSLIHGKQMIEGKLVAAAVETSNMLASHLTYRHSGDGDNRAVTVSATLKGEAKPREITVVLKDVRTLTKEGKPNRHWTGGQVDQQLCYSGARTWARRHTPAVMLGVYSREEFNEPQEGEAFTGPTIEASALDDPEPDPPAPPPAPPTPDAQAKSLRDQINEEVPMPPRPPPAESAHDRMVDWVNGIIERFTEVTTAKAMFALIDEITPDREVLKQSAPELDKRIGRAVKEANVRLQPRDEEPKDGLI